MTPKEREDNELAEKEQRILDSAIRIFSERGYSGSTTKDIARDAGVAEGTIFRYFPTKKDILRGIMNQTIRLVSERVVLSGVEKIFMHSEGKSLSEVLRELILDRIALADRVLPMGRVIITEALYHEDVRETLKLNLIRPAVRMVAEFQKNAEARGMLRPGIPPEVLLRTVLFQVFGYVVHEKLILGKTNILADSEALDMLVDLAVRGIEATQNERT